MARRFLAIVALVSLLAGIVWLPMEAGDLGKDALKLREAAKAQDVRQTTETLQRIHLKVRELRPED